MRNFKSLWFYIIVAMATMMQLTAHATSGVNALLTKEKVVRYGTDKTLAVIIDGSESVGESFYVNPEDPDKTLSREEEIPFGSPVMLDLTQGKHAFARGKSTQERKPLIVAWRFVKPGPTEWTYLILHNRARARRIRKLLEKKNESLSKDKRLKGFEIAEHAWPSTFTCVIPPEDFRPGQKIHIQVAMEQDQDPINVYLIVGWYSLKECIEHETCKNDPEKLAELYQKIAARKEQLLPPFRGDDRGGMIAETPIVKETVRITLPPPSPPASDDLDLEAEVRRGNVRSFRDIQTLPPPSPTGVGMGLLKVQFLEQTGQVARTNLPCWIYRFRNGRLEDIQPITVFQGRCQVQVPVGCHYSVKIHPKYYKEWDPPVIVHRVAYQSAHIPAWPLNGQTMTLSYRRNKR
jgi:hypothetical protein